MAYQWYRADNSSKDNSVAISGATSKDYNSTTADTGKYLYVRRDGLDSVPQGPIIEYPISNITNTKLAVLDFESQSVGTYVSYTDAQGNVWTPNGAASYPIVQDGNRRGLQLTGTGLLSLRNSNPTFWKKLHDGTTDYTIVFEGRIGNSSNPNAIYGILGTANAANSRIGISMFMDDRSASPRRNHVRLGIFNAGGANVPLDAGQDQVTRCNEPTTIVASYERASGNPLKMYTNRGMKVSTSKGPGGYSTSNATYDMEIGACGNSGLPFIGVIYRISIFQGILSDVDRTRLEGARGTQMELPVINSSVLTVVSDSRYNSFGTWIPISSTKKMLVFRSGTTHTANGRIEVIDFDIPTRTFSNRRIVFDYVAPNDCRDPRGGVMNGKIYIFFVRRDRTSADGNLQIDVADSHGYIRSTDLTGTSWESFVSLGATTYNFTTPWGKPYTTGNTMYVPFWELQRTATSGGNYMIGFHKTTDNGVTWSRQMVYHGTEQCTENVLLVKGNKMIVLSRIETFFGNVGGIAQFISSDGGNTWSSFTRTNLGGGGLNIPSAQYFSDTDIVNVFYQDRAGGSNPGWMMASSKNSFETVFANANAWKTPQRYWYNNTPTSFIPGLGYPDIDGNWIMWCKEDSTSIVRILAREENFGILNQ